MKAIYEGLVTQAIDGSLRARFTKDVRRVDGTPLVMVRKRLAPDEGGRARGAVLLVHGFGQNRYAWHMSGRSLSCFLAAQGYDVFNLDLRGHGRSVYADEDRVRESTGFVRRTDSVDVYVREDLPAALAAVRSASGFARPFVLGHSMGALVSGAAIARGGEEVAGLGALAVPFHFARGSRTLGLFARALGSSLLEGAVLGAAHRRVPVALLGRAIEHTRPAWDSAGFPMPVRAWAPGSLTPDEAREYLRTSFDSAPLGSLLQLARMGAGARSFSSLDGREDYGALFSAVRAPLLVMAGTRDQLAPPASVRPAYEAARTADRTYLELDAGHGDLLIGRQAPRGSWEALLAWMRARGGR